jgi:hypothetical protein
VGDETSDYTSSNGANDMTLIALQV